VLRALLRRYPALRTVDLPPMPGAAPARPEWAEAAAGADARAGAVPGAGAEAAAIARAVRLWPHRLRGEGHFLALLQKDAATPGGAGWADERAGQSVRADRAGPLESGGRGVARRGDRGRDNAGEKALAEAAVLFRAFCQEYLAVDVAAQGLVGPYALQGEALWQLPPGLPDLAGLRVLRTGLHTGSVRKGRFEPAHALALALPAHGARQRLDLAPDSEAVFAYLRGETLPAAGHDGWVLVTVGGFPLGWGKAAAGTLKNFYPKGLRWSLARDRDGTVRTKPIGG
jgi:NOL1/NOP2/fmu family ribosome biogenesis protein